MLPTDDSSETLLDADEVLEAVAALGDRDRFEVAYTLYAMDAEAATLEAIAAETEHSETDANASIGALRDAGVVTERMPCLVDPTVDGPEYELTEFGRLLLEEGVLALFEAAEQVDEVEFGAL
ncbi:ArsR family transcriptional regulator [Haloterrigena alkaliphila]|uniref:ArsR family transcriptional regulator n=1 Tax=Haloterrigena alkaliphila TaxID=2816475 RepID=A0A8A2VFI2_9EURY|nr:ArsR family transcriptional regulator [Haloterrigena alkaliphila]QSW99427.1 ArsR family transcriptional regulator [Haloterrigena alkaliphila]